MPNNITTITVLKAQASGNYNAANDKASNVIGKKLEAARQARSLTLRALAGMLQNRGIEVEYQALWKWEKGNTIPNAYQLLALCDVLEIPDAFNLFMNSSDSLNAEGMKKLYDFREDLIASGRYKPEPPVKKSVVRYVEMPVSTLSASAGTGEFLDDENIVLMRFPETSVPSGADFALRIVGDSMEPVYQDHQLVWVHVCNVLRPGDVGIFVLDGAGYIKAYDEQEPNIEEREEYTDSSGIVHQKPVLVSYNEKYAPKVVGLSSQFKICGRVLN